jgi:hypothetical protein
LRRSCGPLAICGKKSRFARTCGRHPVAATRQQPPHSLANHPCAYRKRSQRSAGRSITTGVDEVSSNSISYLPATFTTLFFLAASLLLGLMN